MHRKIKAIENGNKLRTTRDIYPDGKHIPAGAIFYACDIDPKTVADMEVKAISGFGTHLTPGIRVTNENPKIHFHRKARLIIFLPLDSLQLVE